MSTAHPLPRTHALDSPSVPLPPAPTHRLQRAPSVPCSPTPLCRPQSTSRCARAVARSCHLCARRRGLSGPCHPPLSALPASLLVVLVLGRSFSVARPFLGPELHAGISSRSSDALPPFSARSSPLRPALPKPPLPSPTSTPRRHDQRPLRHPERQCGGFLRSSTPRTLEKKWVSRSLASLDLCQSRSLEHISAANRIAHNKFTLTFTRSFVEDTVVVWRHHHDLVVFLNTGNGRQRRSSAAGCLRRQKGA